MSSPAVITSLVAASLLNIAQAIPGPWDLSQDMMDLRKPKITGYFRIEALILKLDNPRGTTRKWMPCDVVSGKCDPIIDGAIDYHTPNYDFGKDSIPYSRYLRLLDASGENNVDINKIMSKDVCNHSTRKVNVRIRARDKDLLINDSIDHFSCFIQTSDPPAVDDASSKWSDELICKGHNSAHKIHWKYRWFFIPNEQCKEDSGSSGVIRRYIPFIGK